MQRTIDRTRWWEIHDPDEYVCPDCGRGNDHPTFQQWEVHHIDRQPGKVVALCRICHNVRHGAERWRIDIETWKEEFVSIG